MSSGLLGHDGSLRPELVSYRTASVGRVIFMVDPSSFDVVAAINPHMRAADGSLQRIDKDRAHRQWEALATCYRSLGFHVSVMVPEVHCPDMVFCANQTFPFFTEDGKPAVILSNMADDTRHLEVESLRSQLEARGVQCFELPARTAETLFEGMGDALWVPGRALICGGYGFRTRAQVYQDVARLTGAEVILFELTNPKFYHLDTCLSILDAQTVLACREGFTEQGWQDLQRVFARIIEVPTHEADAPGFACNAHCPDQKHVILQKGSSHTVAALREAGFIPIELDTSEFIKSGGSVFCMKLQCLWDEWPLSYRADSDVSH